MPAQRKVFRISIDASTKAFTATQIMDTCAGCGEIAAVIARDLDGDGVLDVIALDTNLRIYTAIGNGMIVADPFAGSTNGPFVTVSTTVTGAIP